MKLQDIRPDVLITESEDEGADVDRAPAPGKLGEYITTKQAAKILGKTPGRIRQYIQDGRLKSYAPEIGRRDNMLKLSAVNKLKDNPPERTGRPDEGKGHSEKDKE